MKYLKLALISILILFLVVTAISLFIPSDIRISRAIDISAERETVRNEFVKLEIWEKWFPDYNLDSATTYLDSMHSGIVISASDSSLQFRTNGGEWVAEITKKGRPPIISGWNFIESEQVDFLTLQWYMDFRLRWYPWEKFSSLLFDKMYGGQMEQELARLKQILESDRSSNP